MDALWLVKETIAALTASDAERLRVLAEAAPVLHWPETVEDRKELMARHKVLAQMLGHTRRNLRLMGSRSILSGAVPDGYGALRH
jgi:hypothetical protein